MSELSRFYWLIIRMYYDDDPPPHFHVQYGEYQAKITIDTLAVLTGYLPARALGLVVEWGLLARWRAAENHEELLKIDPLP
jgi:hypothetical protein